MPKTVNDGVKTQIEPASGKIVRLMKKRGCSLFFPRFHLWVAMILLSLALLPYQCRKRPLEDMTKGTGHIRRIKLESCLGIFQSVCYTNLGETVFSSVERGIWTRYSVSLISPNHKTESPRF